MDYLHNFQCNNYYIISLFSILNQCPGHRLAFPLIKFFKKLKTLKQQISEAESNQKNKTQAELGAVGNKAAVRKLSIQVFLSSSFLPFSMYDLVARARIRFHRD